jgi:hypothetical protein
MNKPRQRKFRIGPLTNIVEVCGELAKLYRRVAHDHISSVDGTRMANILGVLRTCMETSIIEQRLTEIEAQVTRAIERKTRAPILLNGTNTDGECTEANSDS